MELEDIFNILSIIISIGALIVSITVAVSQHIQKKTFFQAELNSKYHDEIFLKHLLHGIPEARAHLWFNHETGRLEDTKQLSDELTDMLRGAVYYKYRDREFYDKLRSSVQAIEDYVMECGNKQFDQEDQSKVWDKIREMLESLYSLINEKYIGK